MWINTVLYVLGGWTQADSGGDEKFIWTKPVWCVSFDKIHTLKKFKNILKSDNLISVFGWVFFSVF